MCIRDRFISAHALKENTGTDCGEEEAEALLKNYKKLLYNDLFDTKHRLQDVYKRQRFMLILP